MAIVTYQQAVQICEVLAPICKSRVGRAPYSEALTAAEIAAAIVKLGVHGRGILNARAASRLMEDVMEVIDNNNSPYWVGLYPFHPHKYVVNRLKEEEEQQPQKLPPTRFEREEVI